MGVTVIDDRKVSVTLDAVPKRIVTLLPSLAETVCELGECQRLVGTDNFADWPQSVKDLPKVGGLYDASVEAIVRLKPDLVLAAKSTRIIARLESLGIKVIALEPQSLPDVKRSMHTIAVALQLPQPHQAADRLWQNALLSIDKAAMRLPASVQGSSFYFEAGAGGYAASEASFIGGVMQMLGLKNIVGTQWGAFPQLSPEYVVRSSVQWILIAEPADAAWLKRPGWRDLPAIQSGQWCVFSHAQSQLLVRPGPRLGEAASIIADCLRKNTKP